MDTLQTKHPVFINNPVQLLIQPGVRIHVAGCIFHSNKGDVSHLRDV